MHKKTGLTLSILHMDLPGRLCYNKENELEINGRRSLAEMTREHVLRILKEEHLWKAGECDTLKVKLSQEWEFILRREEETYFPNTFSLSGNKIGSKETWSRRYKTMEDALLHIVNHLNENASVRNRYQSIDEWLLEGK